MHTPACFPGTVIPISPIGLLDGIYAATNGITLSQVREITGLEAGTVQNWVKRGYVNQPVGRKYSKGQLARIILINILRETFAIERIAELLSYVNGDLLDRSDDLMDDSDIYKCLCQILLDKDAKSCIDKEELCSRISQCLDDFPKIYPGADDKLSLALEAMIYACQAAEFKKAANSLVERIKQ